MSKHEIFHYQKLKSRRKGYQVKLGVERKEEKKLKGESILDIGISLNLFKARKGTCYVNHLNLSTKMKSTDNNNA